MASRAVLGGRYEIHSEIGSGGMATVALGRLRGAAGFSRVVAIKRMHPHLAKDAEIVAMFLDEARLASRVRHPNVVAIMDVVGEGAEIFSVMDYVPGMALHRVIAANKEARQVPPAVALRVVHDGLLGLTAAHRATGERGQPLNIVHRDVSPQNLLVGDDGLTRILDFGVAKAEGRMQERTRTNETKGKIAYMSPEQILGEDVDVRTDIYAMGVCLWELLVGQRAYQGQDTVIMRRVLEETLAPPSEMSPDVPVELDGLVARATARDASGRFASAAAMADAIEALGTKMVRHEDVKAWLFSRVGTVLAERAELVERIEAGEATEPEETAEPPAPAAAPTKATAEAVAEASAGTATKTALASEPAVTTLRHPARPFPALLVALGVAAATVIGWALFVRDGGDDAANPAKAEPRTGVPTAAQSTVASTTTASASAPTSASSQAPDSAAAPASVPRPQGGQVRAPTTPKTPPTSAPRKETLY